MKILGSKTPRVKEQLSNEAAKKRAKKQTQAVKDDLLN